MMHLALIPAFVAMGSGSAVAGDASRYLAEHVAFDVSGVMTWRAAWADDRSPGFQALGGGGEVLLGLELDNSFGVLLGGRVLSLSHVTPTAPSSGTFLEGSGEVLGTFRLSNLVRIGLGGQVGRFWRCCGEDAATDLSAIVYGGFVRIGLDVLPIQSLPRALVLHLRLGLDGMHPVSATTQLPNRSLSLALGFGLRI